VHNLASEAAAYHRALADTLHEQYGTPRLYESIPPHVTIKAPFEASDDLIEIIQSRLRRKARAFEGSQGNLSIGGLVYMSQKVDCATYT
jgi:2'-5' RNA ligase